MKVLKSRTTSIHDFSLWYQKTIAYWVSVANWGVSLRIQLKESIIKRVKHFPWWNLFILLIFIGTETFLVQGLQKRETKQN